MPLCKSFACHSYANTRDGGVNIPPVSTSVSLRLCELCGESVALFLRLRDLQPTTVDFCFLLALCFHILTNCFSRKPFPLIIIHIAPGVWGRPMLQRPHQPANVGGRYIRRRGRRRKAGPTAKGIVRCQPR